MEENPDRLRTRVPENPKIIFFGTPRFAQIVLEELVKSLFKPQLVVTIPDAQAGRGLKPQPSPVKQTAIKHQIDLLHPEKLDDSNFQFQISNFKFQIAILVAYGKIIPKEILEIPKYGFINVHPSLLPKYRGPSPIQAAILAGEEKTGVSIMILDEEVDHGPLLAQKEIAIAKNDTSASLVEKLGKIGAGLLIEVLPKYFKWAKTNEAWIASRQKHDEASLQKIFDLKSKLGAGVGLSEAKLSHRAHNKVGRAFFDAGKPGKLKIYLPPKPQNHSQATFTKHIRKSDGYINLTNPPDPQTFGRMVRAFYPWPGVWTEVKVKARLPARQVKVKSGKEITVKFLPGNLIQPEGKRPLSISEFRNGYPEVFEQIKHL